MEKVLTPKFMVSWPNVFKPAMPKGATEAKYSLQMIFDKSEDLTKMKELIKETAKAKWGDKVPKNLTLPFNDGDVKKEGQELYSGKVYINASSKFQPGLVDKERQDIIDEGEFYAGCFARATLNAYAYDVSGNKGVAFGLQNIQKLADGTPLSGGKNSAADDFSDDLSSGDFEM